MAATAVKPLVSEEEYLHGHYGDRTPEYVEGEIVERTMPNNIHSKIHALLVHLFLSLRNSAIHVRPEIRLRVTPRTFRIVDVAVFWPVEPVSLVPEITPFVIIEIVSPDDAWSDITAKVNEYLAMGVQHVWLVDPQTRTMAVHTGSGQANVSAFELPQFGLKISIADLLAESSVIG